MKGGNNERLCVACRKLGRKEQMIRFVRLDGKVSLDSDQKAEGRGAYVCRKEECIRLLMEKHFLRKALHTPSDEDALKEAMASVTEEVPNG